MYQGTTLHGKYFLTREMQKHFFQTGSTGTFFTCFGTWSEEPFCVYLLRRQISISFPPFIGMGRACPQTRYLCCGPYSRCDPAGPPRCSPCRIRNTQAGAGRPLSPDLEPISRSSRTSSLPGLTLALREVRPAWPDGGWESGSSSQEASRVLPGSLRNTNAE